MHTWVGFKESHIQSNGNFIQVPASQPPHPFSGPPSPSVRTFWQMSLGLVSAWSWPFWPGLRSLLMHHLYCSSRPSYLTVHPASPSHCLRYRPPPFHHAHCHCLTDFATTVECAGIVITVKVSEPTSPDDVRVFNEECNMWSARAHTESHQSCSFFASKGLIPKTPTYSNHLGQGRTRRSHCQSHNSEGSLDAFFWTKLAFWQNLSFCFRIVKRQHLVRKR